MKKGLMMLFMATLGTVSAATKAKKDLYIQLDVRWSATAAVKINGFDFLQVGDDAISGHKAVRVRALVLGAWEPDRPVGRDQGERVPSMAPGLPGLLRLLQ